MQSQCTRCAISDAHPDWRGASADKAAYVICVIAGGMECSGRCVFHSPVRATIGTGFNLIVDAAALRQSQQKSRNTRQFKDQRATVISLSGRCFIQ